VSFSDILNISEKKIISANLKAEKMKNIILCMHSVSVLCTTTHQCTTTQACTTTTRQFF